MAKRARGLDRVKQMLAGDHYTQTRRQFSMAESFKKQRENSQNTSREKALKKPGDIWEEKDGNGKVIKIHELGESGTIKQYQPAMYHIKKKHSDLDEILHGYPNCLEDCQTEVKTRLDEKYRRFSGMCADCHFRVEERMKVNGEYEDYLREKMYKNAIDWFKDADKEIQIVAEQMRKGIEMEREDGSIKKWLGGQDPEEMLAEYEEAKRITLENLKPKKKTDDANADGNESLN